MKVAEVAPYWSITELVSLTYEYETSEACRNILAIFNKQNDTVKPRKRYIWAHEYTSRQLTPAVDEEEDDKAHNALMTNEAEPVKEEVCIIMGAEAHSMSGRLENIDIYEICQDSKTEEKEEETGFHFKAYIGIKEDKFSLNIKLP